MQILHLGISCAVSHNKGYPVLIARMAIPFDRQPSTRPRPCGSRIEKMSAEPRALLAMSSMVVRRVMQL